jgi:hypothetical protein
MSQENVHEAGGQTAALIRYRVWGGIGVDQRLTVFDDGAVELDERHRSRDSIWVHVDAPELGRLRSALDELPPERWSPVSRLALARLRRWITGSVKELVGLDEDEQLFQLTQGGRAILGDLRTGSSQI